MPVLAVRTLQKTAQTPKPGPCLRAACAAECRARLRSEATTLATIGFAFRRPQHAGPGARTPRLVHAPRKDKVCWGSPGARTLRHKLECAFAGHDCQRDTLLNVLQFSTPLAAYTPSASGFKSALLMYVLIRQGLRVRAIWCLLFVLIRQGLRIRLQQ